MSRRGRGEDSIYFEGGRWRGAVSLGYGPDGRRQRKKVSGVAKAEVVRKMRELRAELDAGLPVPDDRLTVGKFLDRWVVRNLPNQVSGRTLDYYANTARLHLVPALGRIVLRKLSVDDVESLLAYKREQGYSANSLRIMRQTLRRALRQAEREGLIVRNVAALSTAPRVAGSTEGRSLTVEQARVLLDAVKGTRHEALFTLILAFGLRRGEALGLHWSGLDLTTATLKVTHGVKRATVRDGSGGRTRVVLGELKTTKSRRTLFLTPELVEVLRRQRVFQAQERITLGEAWQDLGLIFPSEVGTVMDPDNISHMFSRICQRAGLGHWHLHELRHSGASLMLAQGTDLYVVSEVLGHSSVAITKDVYGHLVEGQKRAAAALMSAALFSEIGSQNGSQER